MPEQVVGMGVLLAQFRKNEGSPRFEPVMFTNMPGAIGPATIEAAFATEAAVKVGVCAAAEKAQKENETVIPISDVRNGYSISDDIVSKYSFSVANLMSVSRARLLPDGKFAETDPP
jgi:hypothetical protein